MADDVIGKLQFIVEVDSEKGITSIKKFDASVNDSTKTTQDAEKKQTKAFEGINLKAVAVATAVGTAVVKMAKEVAKATNEIQDGRKTIVQATGATGEALDGLMESAKNVFATVDESFDEVATALGEINTRFGYTGQILEDTTRMFLDFAEATGQDVQNAVKSSAQVINQWNLTAEEMPLLLDKLTVAGQVSGVSVSQLSANLTDSAGTLQAMGYSLDEAIALMMSFEKQGIDSSSVLMGMKQSFAQSAKAGTDARKDWENLIGSIANATDEAEANEKAINAFGNRVASTLVTALRNGKISTDEFADALNGAEGALTATDEAGKTTADRIQTVKNQITIALADLGESFVPLIEDILPVAVALIEGFAKAMGYVVDAVKFFKESADEARQAGAELISVTDDEFAVTMQMYEATLKNANAQKEMANSTNDASKYVSEYSGLVDNVAPKEDRWAVVKTQVAEAQGKVNEATEEGTKEAGKQEDAVETLTLAEKELADAREKNAEKYITLLQEQQNERTKNLADELQTQGFITQAYDLRLKLVKEQHAKDRAELEALIAEKKATADDMVRLEQIQTNEIRAINDQMYRDIDAQRQASVEAYKQTLSDMVDAVNADLGTSVHNLVSALSDEFASAEDKMRSLQKFTASAFGTIGNALSDLGKDLVMGGDAWSNLGKSALRALASIVRALAEEMTARAVIAMFSLNWSGASLLGAGAVSAYIASGLIEGWANSLAIGKDFVPYDGYPATLHMGEMVLDRQDADRFRNMGGIYGVEKAVSAPLAVSSANGINAVNVNSNLSAVIEVDGVQLGVAVLKNIDDASQFVLR